MRLANVYRGDHLESFHSGSIAVVDSLGRLLAFAGDPAFVTCIRSAAKPFQALPLLEYGGGEEGDPPPAGNPPPCAPPPRPTPPSPPPPPPPPPPHLPHTTLPL